MLIFENIAAIAKKVSFLVFNVKRKKKIQQQQQKNKNNKLSIREYEYPCIHRSLVDEATFLQGTALKIRITQMYKVEHICNYYLLYNIK